MTAAQFNFDHHTIHYRTGGHGDTPLICFHGYGESSTRFDFLEPHLTHQFTIIAIDLPYHGHTQWTDLQPAALAATTSALLAHLNIPPKNIHLLGFSLGARIALCLLQQMPASISKAVLLAPDGLTINFWYWLSTQTTIGNSLFRLTMKKPGWFLGMLRTSAKLRIVNQSILKFVENYIHDDTIRRQLYQRWTGLRKCKPNKATLRRLIPANNIRIELLYGRYDRNIGQKKGKQFIKGLPNANMQVLNCGHQVLHEKNAGAIVSALLQ
ncbi:MAG TPA: alpha/beta hydrolase [Chitinophagaceae bacterium]|nr:alpha/beta hydrolase [Chitinophagaceae bacterium]